MQKATPKTSNLFWLLWIALSTLIYACTPHATLPEHIVIGEAQLYSPDTSISLSADLPATVYDALEQTGIIPNPYTSNNEEHVQWVSEKRWIYKMEFELSESLLKKEMLRLAAKQLDTYSTVFLNGQEIAKHESAFYPLEITLDKTQLKAGTNTLEIHFEPLKEFEAARQKSYGLHLPEGSRPFSRKAQFQYGWDWGMKMKDMGIADVIEIHGYDKIRIKHAHAETVKTVADTAYMTLWLTTESNAKENQAFIIHFDDQEKQINTSKGPDHAIDFKIAQPRLWMPHTNGDQHQYTKQLIIKNTDGQVLDKKEIRFGIRTVELVQDPVANGTSFSFRINGKDIFAQGANIIPSDHRYSQMTNHDLEKLVDNAKAANMNMLRVWGGGFYLPDRFYEYCSEQGILVWQDFMFACAMYPGDSSFLNTVEKEAIYQIDRLNAYPCIALWCGNNESSEGWQRWGWSNAYSSTDSTRIANDYQKLFGELLPQRVSGLAIGIPYWESSPSLGRGDSSYIYSGDAHNWWVWHDGAPFTNFEDEIPRFMSEFGFQSFPSLAAMDSMAQGGWPDAKELATHQKHGRGFSIIDTYWKRNLPPAQNREDSVYLTQVLQAIGMEKGMRAHKTDAICGGSLYWQLNDCWPVISWSSLDYYGYWKALHYRAKKAFDKYALRLQISNDSLRAYVHIPDLSTCQYDVVIVKDDKAIDSLISLSIVNDAIRYKRGLVWETDLAKYELGNENYVKLLADINGKEKRREIVPCTNWKDYPFKPNTLEWKLLEEGKAIEIKASAFNAFVYIQSPFKQIEDNFFHMEAGEKRVIHLPEKVDEEGLDVFSLNRFY